MASANQSLASLNGHKVHHTRIVTIDAAKIRAETITGNVDDTTESADTSFSSSSEDESHINEAATLLRTTDIPVAFPTETVYGLGADATRSPAVQGIYKAKKRPADNPLIVHVSSPSQIQDLFISKSTSRAGAAESVQDPIPQIYHQLIKQFWPGPLTILLPLPEPSPFAPEVTAGLSTVGIRMPASPIALALIRAAGVPLAAPSANASTRPSPTTAAHVLHDLDGRVDMILDGGPCTVGVESTVVDGLHDPPLILRPGGVSIEMLRCMPGWQNVQIGYEIRGAKEAPRAPGMKYKHYSPKARVLLFKGQLDVDVVRQYAELSRDFGILRTSDETQDLLQKANSRLEDGDSRLDVPSDPWASAVERYHLDPEVTPDSTVYVLRLGPSLSEVAKGLFSALRAFDNLGVGVIFVESIEETLGDEAAAITNRLRKAAENEP